MAFNQFWNMQDNENDNYKESNQFAHRTKQKMFNNGGGQFGNKIGFSGSFTAFEMFVLTP